MNNVINSCARLSRRAFPFLRNVQGDSRSNTINIPATYFSSSRYLYPTSVAKIHRVYEPIYHFEEKQDFFQKTKFFFAFYSGLLLTLLFYNLNEDNAVHAAKPFNKDEVERYLNTTRDEKLTGTKKPVSNREKYNFIADVVDKVAESVVCVVIRDFEVVDFFTGTPKVVSNGSGFIVSEDGLIVTNAHVVVGSSRPSISVRLADGRNYAARVEYVDSQSDLATIRINAKGLKPLPLGCSKDTRLGEWVVALGSPLSLANTVTAGVVSSANRGASEIGIKNDIDYIQTDAAITFGNSGGPLVNLDGEVIGINSMKVAAGISFAIPIDHVKKFLDKSDYMKKNGKAATSRRYVGLTMLTLTDEILADLQMRGKAMDIKYGVIVWRVIVGSPAFLSGLQPGDIIMRINDRDIQSAADVHNAVLVHDTLRLIIRRNDKNYKIDLTPENIPIATE